MTRILGEASARYLADLHAQKPEATVTGEEWLALDRADRRAADDHRTVTETDVDHRPDDAVRAPAREREPVRAADESTDASGAPTPSDRADDHDTRGDEVRAREETQDPPGDDDEPISETAIADIRDAVTPIAVDEDTVHAAGADEADAANTRTREVAAELRNRQLLEAQHDADERNEQLAAWHAEDHGTEDDDGQDAAAARGLDEGVEDVDTDY